MQDLEYDRGPHGKPRTTGAGELNWRLKKRTHSGPDARGLAAGKRALTPWGVRGRRAIHAGSEGVARYDSPPACMHSATMLINGISER